MLAEVTSAFLHKHGAMHGNEVYFSSAYREE